MLGILLPILGIIVLIVIAVGYFSAYAYGVILGARAHPAWVVVCLLIGPIAVMATIIYAISKKNIFEIIKKEQK